MNFHQNKYQMMKSRGSKYSNQRRAEGQSFDLDYSTEYGQAYTNPVNETFIHIAKKLLGVYKSKEKDNRRSRYEQYDDYDDYYHYQSRHRRSSRMEMYMRGGMGGMIFEDYQRDNRSPVEKAIESRSQLNFEKIVDSINSNFKRRSGQIKNNRKDCSEILMQIELDNDRTRRFNKEAVTKKWKLIEDKIKDKVSKLRQQYHANIKSFEGKEIQYQDKPNFQEENEFLKLKKIDQLKIKNLILEYLAKPSRQLYFAGIIKFQNSSRDILDKYHKADYDLTNVMKNLPFKQSSYYWQKLIDCVQQVSPIYHYENLKNQKIPQFEAEYVGNINSQTIRSVVDREWLDNKVTSSVIEYLKHVQGANNYHKDGKRNAYIFNHSQTNIFITSPFDNNEDYLEYDKLIFLINIESSHWLVMVVYNQKQQLSIYDSMPGSDLSHYTVGITNKLKNQYKKKNPFESYNLNVHNHLESPKQTNTSDCGVFSIINIISAFDKDRKSDTSIYFKLDIITHIRYALFLFLLYLGYVKKECRIPRKDYFTFIFRSTINDNFYSRHHCYHQRGIPLYKIIT